MHAMTNPTIQPDVLVIDYGVGNIRSVCTALARLGYAYRLSCDPEEIVAAPAYILPGVGAFKEAMQNLQARGITDTLKREVLEHHKPLLGICLGMQVLAEDSTEDGTHQGLGLIPGHVVRIPQEGGVRVPHVGWNDLSVRTADPLFSNMADGSRYYFDHSYHFATDAQYVAATTEHGSTLTAAVQHGNIYGVQFHPEKSQTSGLRLLRAFMQSVVPKHL